MEPRTTSWTGMSPGVGGAAVEDGEEGVHAAFAEEFGVEADGGEFGVDGGGEGEVVEAGDGEVVGDAQAEAADGLVGAGGEFVVVADEGGGAGAGAGEGGCGGCAGVFDGDGGVDGAYVGAGDGGEACGEFAGAYVEGPGGDVGGEVEEVAVAEVEEVVGDLADAVGDVEVDGGGAGLPAGSLSSMTRGSWSPRRAVRASAAMEEARTPSRAAWAEGKGSRAGPMPSGEG